MESTTGRQLQEAEKQASIRRQIAELQAQLVESSSAGDEALRKPVPASPKRKQSERHLLAPSTPSPKRRRLNDASNRSNDLRSSGRTLPSLASHISKSLPKANTPIPGGVSQPSKPGPSTLVSKLAGLAKSRNEDREVVVARTSAFSERPAPPPPLPNDEGVGMNAQRRDDRLALVEDLELGPAEHKAPFDDPHFEQLEPNSSIRLSSRTLPYDDFQDYLRGRYYLSPSKLYSVIRLLPNKQGYDVPVEGDWVTIAVIAERGPMKYTKAPVGVGREDQEHLPAKDDKLDDLVPTTDANSKSKVTDLRHWKGKAKQDASSKPSGKKYINLKLIDFGCRSGSSSTTGGKSVIRGDAFLSLLLFEADKVEEVVGDDGKKQKIYRGGSRGAFERMSKLKEGAVVALLNPRILKPFQRSGDAPHPTDNILAVTPESIDSTIVIGQSRDLGMCKAIKRDSKACGSWCDKRIGDVCDWHIQNAVQSKRAARPEFSLGTGGMSAAAKKKVAYDPTRQWGLKPEPSRSQGDGATYVVSGHVISGGTDPKNMFVAETVGRDAQAKAARKASVKDADRALERLLKKDKDGMKALAAAREFGKRPIGVDKGDKRSKEPKDSKKRKRRSDESSESSSSSEDEEETSSKTTQKSAYSAQLIRNLGFDPTCKDGKKSADLEVQKKLEALAAAHSSRRDIDLGPRPGKKRSSVRPPTVTQSNSQARAASPSVLQRLASMSDDELEREEFAVLGNVVTTKMIDLDSSDVE